MEKHNMHSHSGPNKRGSMYSKLANMAIVSFFAMYLLMYVMVDKFQNVIPNINQFYMAGLMTAAMVVIELLLMRNMYPSKKMNIILVGASFLLGITFFTLIRTQAGVKDPQFLKSMIPHHAAAILMVKEAQLSDPEVKALADSIISAQEREIQFMKQKLKDVR